MIDTFMMPYGTECDLYQIMGEIKNVESAVNEYTDEKLYFMTLSCNDMIFDICINQKDLLGEPEEGRRFKGSIWMQGHINFEKELDWQLLSYESHRKLQTFVKDLNHFYLENSAMWEIDDSWDGFQWLVHDDNTQNVVIFRRTNDEGDDVIAICNFAPVERDGYRFGIPEQKNYEIVLNSDDIRYGGTGIPEKEVILSEKIAMHGKANSIAVDIPPMSVMYLKPSSIQPEDEQESEEQAQEDSKSEEDEKKTFTPKQDPAYDLYTPLVEPLYAAGILEQDFSQEQPVELDSYDWYNLLTGLDEQAAPFQGMDGNSHYAQDTVEQLLTEHFDVEVEKLRKESEGYSEEFGTYIEPEEVEDSAVPGRISGAQEKDGTLVLVVDLYSPQGKVYNTSVLTIQLQQAESEKEENENILSSLEGWKYLSNTVIYHSDQK